MDYDYIIIGSGFGGSVSALRLAEKGYKVLVIEQGKWYRTQDFPKTNWNIRKWLWIPALRCFGIMKITIFKDVGFISGTGVGGGSLVYANTLPVPEKEFFQSGSWKSLADWQNELTTHYQTALKMLGASPTPKLFAADHTLRQMANDISKAAQFKPTEVAVYFGEPRKTVSDPYFDGKGPDRSGCTYCGGCMTGCRENAKNTLDKNYLHLAQQHGAEILAEHVVTGITPVGNPDGSDGYAVRFKSSTKKFSEVKTLKTNGLIFSGGVLGTVKLLLNLKATTLPALSDMVGRDVRTNNESLIAVTSLDAASDLSQGVAIGSILHADADSHLEVVRYGKGSGAWRVSFLPYVEGRNFGVRILKMLADVLLHPVTYLRYAFVRDWAKNSVILLFMQSIDSTVTFSSNRFGKMRTQVVGKDKPTAFIPQATEFARRFEKLLKGKAMAFGLTPLAGIPGTAHILGGAVMGDSPQTGVIDANNKVFGYRNMYVCDGSMISANPGVNPSLSITAITERAMSKIPAANA